MNNQNFNEEHFEEGNEDIRYYEKLFENNPKSLIDFSACESLISHYIQNGKLEKALDITNHAVKLYPATSELLIKKAQILMDLSRNVEGYISRD